ncbi:lysosomal phospholipase A and acyltransferase-like [Babylonia areolata]|uniref:lysosomal phospholipase A and acyltransferase-like n=1 Tax=Babylonia areolata TaxID=304850 RepID=UPI003FD3D250
MFFKLVLLLICYCCCLCLFACGESWREPWRMEWRGRNGGIPGGRNVKRVTNGLQRRHPVILVPGLGGSQLCARLTDEKYVPVLPCVGTTKKYVNIWVNPMAMLLDLNCTLETLRLHYDPREHVTTNREGVDIRPGRFGDTESVEWLWPVSDQCNGAGMENRFRKRGQQREEGEAAAAAAAADDGGGGVSSSSSSSSFRARALRSGRMKKAYSAKLRGGYSEVDIWPVWKETKEKKRREALRLSGFLPYYAQLVNTLVSNGFTRNKDVTAAPYDFRKSPNEMQGFFQDLRRLIEDTYEKNGNSRVVVVAHSMGNPVLLHFYNHLVSQDWKNRYIRSHVALGAPWGGSVKSLKLMCSGDSMDVPFLESLTLRGTERSLPSVAWLLPSPNVWPLHHVLVSTPTRNYTANDYQELFHDLDHDEGYAMRQDTPPFDLRFPGVEMHCLYGVDVPTPGKLVYSGHAFPDDDPTVVTDDGDGTVNLRSLEAIKEPWREQVQRGIVKLYPLVKVKHLGILKDRRVIDYILRLASNQ